jgi:Zinc carboxypeptidase
MTFRTERRTLPRPESSFPSRSDRRANLGSRNLWWRVPKGREGGGQVSVRSEQPTHGASVRGRLAFLAAVTLAAWAAACGGPEHPNTDERARGASAPSTSRAARFRRRTEELGRSSLGRPIHAVELGAPEAERTVLVVGCIHGTECAGTTITRRLLARARPERSRLWVITQLNPDGHALRTRGKRPRRRPESQLSRSVATDRKAGGRGVPRTASALRARVAVCRPPHPAHPSRRLDLVSPARRSCACVGPGRAGRAALRATCGRPRQGSAVAERDCAELADPPLRLGGLVRRRACWRLARDRHGTTSCRSYPASCAVSSRQATAP